MICLLILNPLIIYKMIILLPKNFFFFAILTSILKSNKTKLEFKRCGEIISVTKLPRSTYFCTNLPHLVPTPFFEGMKKCAFISAPTCCDECIRNRLKFNEPQYSTSTKLNSRIIFFLRSCTLDERLGSDAPFLSQETFGLQNCIP